MKYIEIDYLDSILMNALEELLTNVTATSLITVIPITTALSSVRLLMKMQIHL